MRLMMVQFSALLAAVAFVLMGTGALGTLLGVQMAAAGYSSWTAGLVMSAYFVGLIAGTWTGQIMIGRVGHIRAFSALASALSAAVLIHPYAFAALPWAALRIIEGYCLAGLFLCTESWLNARTGNALRGTIFALYQITVYLAQGLGQILVNIPGPSGLPVYVLASVLISLAVVPVSLTRMKAPSRPAAVRFGFRRLYATSPLGMTGAFASGLLLGAIYGLGPYFAQAIGLDVTGTTLFMGLVITGGLALQWPLGRLSDRYDRRGVLCGLCLAIALASLALAATGGWGLAWLIALAPLFGGVAFTLYPLSVAHANDFIAPRDLVSMSGGLLISYGMGAMAGPLGASFAMTRVGPNGLFVFCAAVGILTAAFAGWRMRIRSAPASSPFQPVPNTTPVVHELDPRVPPEQPAFEFATDARTGSG